MTYSREQARVVWCGACGFEYDLDSHSWACPHEGVIKLCSGCGLTFDSVIREPICPHTLKSSRRAETRHRNEMLQKKQFGEIRLKLLSQVQELGE